MASSKWNRSSSRPASPRDVHAAPDPSPVVIVSRNRRDELRTAVRSALAQTGGHEVLVIDDGSTDGTAEMIRAEFAGVRLVRHAHSRGYIARRNEGAREATGDVVISIDDDAAFTTPSTVDQTLARFDREEIGAVAIPYADVIRSPEVRQLAPDPTSTFVTATFIGTAHALRRDVFQKVGGYREYWCTRARRAISVFGCWPRDMW